MPPPTLDQRLDLVLHIGSGKTGTSSLQLLLRHNRDVLARHGVLFPSTLGQRRHVRFGLFIRPDEELVEARHYRTQSYRSPQHFRRGVMRQLFTEINRTAPEQVLISDEALYASNTASLERLRAFTDRYVRRLRLVCYLRRQDDHLVSRYQQVVKVGEVRTLAEYTAQLGHTKTYDYATRLDTWASVVEPGSFVVRRFERDDFVNGSLYADFFHAAGLDVPLDELEDVRSQNASLDAESVEFLRLLNLHRVTTEGAEVGMINNRPLVVRLANGSSGPTLTLPDSELDAFMARWEGPNRAVAQRWFGGQEQLFGSPRRTRGTTTAQRLDPDRLDHFLAMTELPADLHAPMRQLAEAAATLAR